jgi:24-methylenesterol C-methyltransferase
MRRRVQDVHDMLVHVAQSLVQGGETGIFSPMHLLVFRKPLTDK